MQYYHKISVGFFKKVNLSYSRYDRNLLKKSKFQTKKNSFIEVYDLKNNINISTLQCVLCFENIIKFETTIIEK